MPLLNYTTKVPASRTMAQIMDILVSKGATEIMTIYDGGHPVGLKWRLHAPDRGLVAFALPVKVDAVFEIMTADRILPSDDGRRWEQSLRVAWRIVKDWIEAQMALLETGMVQMEEIFLPYMLTGEQTMYQALMAGDLKVLPPGS